MLNRMMLTKITTSFFLMAVLFVLPSLSYADWSIGIGLGDRHDHPHYGLHVHYLPHGYVDCWVGRARYYYYDGLYYTHVGGDFVLVNPPMGAYVRVIPSDFQPVIVNGRTYYADNGVYYILTQHHGYKVVAAQGEFPINLPNNKGSYTTIVIKKSGNGFVGPQGEFYPQFPSVSQLKTMYVK